jgi:2-polyprenyl-6-methoxyphenol hydroxylase-like FAD-dependent oxidoreductase
MSRAVSADVVIVGAGPVGLCLAMDLAWRGVTVAVAETRASGEPPSVKCNHVSSRTMETFRRLGFADEVRAAGLPDDYPNDVAFRTRATGWELTRIHIPCRRDRFSDTSGPDGWWPTPEPPHRINQIFLEPVLHRRAAAMERLSVLYRTEVEGFEQDEAGITARARDLQTGEDVEIECAYLVGCEGGRSPTRRAIGARLVGDEAIQKVQSSRIRAPALLEMIRGRPAWMSYVYNPERPGNLVAIDGREEWLIHNYLLPHEDDFDQVDRDRCIRAILGAGPEFDYELMAKEDWIGRRMVADRFRDRRAFICGDAAHLWVPYAGYGMNAGIADAMNLSWMLAARLKGWAPESVLDAHEMERQPITEQVSRFAMRHAEGAIRERNTLPAELEEDSPQGAAARAEVGAAAYHLGVQQFACAGLNYGYFYDRSPLIAYDGEHAPAYTMQDYTPSTVPGCRLPHVWLNGRRSLYDALGADYTLLRLDPGADVGPLMGAAAARGLPLELLDVDASGAAAAYRHGLLIVRPDQHVAWRGDAAPADPGALVDRLRGALA